MPQRPVPTYWKDRVKFLLSESRGRLTTKDVWRRLQTEVVLLEKTKRTDTLGLATKCPSERSISRIRKEEWEGLTDVEKAEHKLFFWPEAMEIGLLPWEASTACLEMLYLCVDAESGRLLRRPSVRQARAYWRLTLAAPDLQAGVRLALAAIWAASDTLDWDRHADKRRDLEAFLAHAEWRSQARKETYSKAVDEGDVKRKIGVIVSREQEADLANAMLGIQYPDKFLEILSELPGILSPEEEVPG